MQDAAGKPVTPAVAEVAVKYGAFITNLFDFVVVAFSVFLVIKAINRMKKAEAPAPAAPKNHPVRNSYWLKLGIR